MSTDTGNVISFKEKLERARKIVEAEKAKRGEVTEQQTGIDFSQYAPTDDDLGEGPEPELLQEQEEFNDFIRKYDIVRLYNMWKPAELPVVSNGGIKNYKARCPNPDHPDKNPSFGMHSGKNQWNCGTCGGGDNVALYALTHGEDQYALKNNKELFKRLVKDMALDLGVKVESHGGRTMFRIPGSKLYNMTSEKEVKTEQPEAAQPEPKEESNVVLHPTNPSYLSQEEEGPTTPSADLDWKDILPENTFLREWMEATTVDFSPEPYHFFTGLACLGFAMGRNVMLNEDPPVSANLFISLLGPSTVRKSKAMDNVEIALEEVFKYNSERNEGVKMMLGQASGEQLVESFEFTEDDPINPKVKHHQSVSGYVYYNEMSQLVQKVNNKSSTLGPMLMNLYDGRNLGYHSRGGGQHIGHKPFGTAFSTTQNNSIRDLFSAKDENSGFLNRWIFVTGPRKKEPHRVKVRTDLTIPLQTLKTHATKYNACGVAAGAGSATPGTMLIDYTEAADKLWEEFWDTVVFPDLEANAVHSNLTLRIKLTLFKLQLLFAANMNEMEITEAAVEQAKKIYPYLLHCYGILRENMHKTDSSELTERILYVITKLKKDTGKRPTKKKIYELVKRNVKFDDNLLVKTLKNMQDLSLIMEIEEKRGPTKVFCWDIVGDASA